MALVGLEVGKRKFVENSRLAKKLQKEVDKASIEGPIPLNAKEVLKKVPIRLRKRIHLYHHFFETSYLF